MANRLHPYRNVDPHDEISNFALADAFVNDNITGSGFGDAGVFVTVASGNLSLDPITFTSNSYLGKTDFPMVAWNKYPEITLKVRPAASGDITPLGITLTQTARYDENGQKLLYYREKADAMQVAVPGESVKIATRGIFTVFASAVDGTLTAGAGFKLSATSGKITGCANSDSASLGLVLGAGSRGANGANIPDAYSGAYYQIKLGK
jgi:hypothetical protein